MISHASFQEQVIDTLQAYSDLTDLLPSPSDGSYEIRELHWQGTEFEYPNVRVDVRPQTPEGLGNCRPTISIIDFAVVAFSENDSSLECERICFEIGEALFGTQPEDATPSQGPAWRCETVNLMRINSPRRIPERIWRGEVIFRARVKETS